MTASLAYIIMTLRTANFESTYGVEDNLHANEEATQKTDEKISILGQIIAYQEESKIEEK